MSLTDPELTTVFVGVSGGVDSAVAALLLRQQGYRVHGVFMKNWDEDDDGECPAEQDFSDARKVCERIGIPLTGINFSTEYWDEVFTGFLKEYRAGRTPNPDILCNQRIKFGAFLEYARSQGADFIATGHYARVDHNGAQARLCLSRDPGKDQTYFLHTLNQDQLRHALFPIGHLEKTAVRELAREHNLEVHEKKDSTGICFIGERKFQTFLSRYVDKIPGVIEDTEGNVVGEHIGLAFYTAGQRQGLGIGGHAGSSGEPWYVVDKNLTENILIVAQGHDHPALFHGGLRCEKIHWINKPPHFPVNCLARIRHRHTPAECKLTATSNGAIVEFKEPQRAIAPGQSVVFYDNEICLGGAIIAAPYKSGPSS